MALRRHHGDRADTSPWRANFDHGHPSTVFWRGRRSAVIGTLDTDPARVAIVLDRAARSRQLGPIATAPHVPPGRTLDSTDIARTNRAVIHFERADTTLAGT